MAADARSFVWRDPSMERVVKLAEQVARSEGLGADHRRERHRQGGAGPPRPRQVEPRQPPLRLGQLRGDPEALLESELFGHEKGAFTGAVARRIGRFEEANGGTLLLDEISEMDVRLQSKLLRALQERVIDRVGGAAPVKVDIRVLATSNRNLAEEVKKGTFREDLFYRLNVVHLRLPPLRERPADILELAAHFARKYAEINGVPVRALDRAAQGLVARNPWRGNVRELENTIHRAVLLAQGPEIGPDAILSPEGESLGQPAPTGPVERRPASPKPPPRASSAAPWPMSSAT